MVQDSGTCGHIGPATQAQQSAGEVISSTEEEFQDPGANGYGEGFFCSFLFEMQLGLGGLMGFETGKMRFLEKVKTRLLYTKVYG